MLIFVKKDTPEAAIRSLVIQLSRQGIGTARADSAGRTMLTLVGETWTLDEQRLLALPYVAEVKRLTPVWRLASRQTHTEDTVVSVGDAQIGKGFCLMAGPCAVESALQMQGVARAVKAAGGLVLRGLQAPHIALCFSGLRRACAGAAGPDRKGSGIAHRVGDHRRGPAAPV